MKKNMFAMQILAGVVGVGLSTAALADDKDPNAEVMCFCVNECKGTGDCGGNGEANSCYGQNSCKGRGYVNMARSECADKGGSEQKPAAGGACEPTKKTE